MAIQHGESIAVDPVMLLSIARDVERIMRQLPKTQRPARLQLESVAAEIRRLIPSGDRDVVRRRSSSSMRKGGKS